MRNFRNYEIWKMSMRLCKEVYKISKEIPEKEKFNLISQIQKCAVSIPSNIAEGCSRGSDIAFIRFLEIAIGSAFELETQLILCKDLELVREIEPTLEDLNVLQAKINSLIQKLKSTIR